MVDLFQQAVALHKAGRVDEAGTLYREVIATPGGHPHAHYLLGNILLDRNEPYEARRHLIGAVRRDASNATYHTALGLAFERLGDDEMAESSFRMAASLNRRYAEARLQLGRMLARKGRVDESADVYASVLEVDPANERALFALLELRKHQGRAGELRSLLDAAILGGLAPALALRAKCSLYDGLASHSEALEAAQAWLTLAPGAVEPLFAAGVALIGLNRLEEGLEYLLRAHSAEPDHLETIVNLGHTLQKLERFPEAIRYYCVALQRDTERTPALHGLTFSLFKAAGKKYPGNLRLARRAALELVERDRQRNSPHAGLGTICLAHLMVREGVACFRRALELAPQDLATSSSLLFHNNYSDEISRGEHHRLHLDWGRALRKQVGAQWKDFPQPDSPDKHLRIGFISADLTYHPVAYFLMPVVQGLAPHAEVFLYSALPEASEDNFTARFREHAHAFRRIKVLNDEDAAHLIREDAVDVLFDLSGHTTGHRLGIFARRAAPVQVSWLGYPNTTGLDSIDFRISDDITEPASEGGAYSSERIVRLPQGFHTFRPFYGFPDVAPLPALRNGYLTLGCFNNMKKVSPRVLALWARVMKALPGVRLLLKDRTLDFAENRERMRSLFASHGVDPRRIALSGMIENNAAHLALYSQVDIALDSFPYNGTTTTCEALYMGCPVVSLAGDRHVARVTASLLTHAGHPEWIASDEDAYVALVARLASDPAGLAAIRARLRQDMISSPLCDGAAFADAFLKAVRWMWREWCAGRCGPSRTVNTVSSHQAS